jgi:hypothetical protein
VYHPDEVIKKVETNKKDGNIGIGFGKVSKAPKEGMLGAVGPKKGRDPNILEKCNFAACDTVHVCSCIFIFWRSSISFGRDDCTWSEASVSVLWSDVRVYSGYDWVE